MKTRDQNKKSNKKNGLDAIAKLFEFVVHFRDVTFRYILICCGIYFGKNNDLHR